MRLGKPQKVAVRDEPKRKKANANLWIFGKI
jgi:hypothetical protein